MVLKGAHPHARPGGDRPSHCHQGGDHAMNNIGWLRGPIAKMVVAASVGLAGGLGQVAVEAAASPAPTVSPDVGASPSTSASPSTGASPTTPSPGSGSGNMNCPNM